MVFGSGFINDADPPFINIFQGIIFFCFLMVLSARTQGRTEGNMGKNGATINTGPGGGG